MTSLSDQLIQLALAEDIGTGDITTDALIDPASTGAARIFAKEPLILAGVDIASRVFHRLDPEIRVRIANPDGSELRTGDTILELEGSLRYLLTGERTALNFLQRLSGIATHVRSYVKQIEGLSIRLTDTRKTTPGLRILEKYAVRVGGADNHRMGLFDGVLIKDNHIVACGGILPAVKAARQRIHHMVRIEVETSNLMEVRQALEAGADIIMLDNMTVDQIREATDVIQGKALVEISGGVNRDTIRDLAQAGVNIVSVGALTHGARSVDISMDICGNIRDCGSPEDL